MDTITANTTTGTSTIISMSSIIAMTNPNISVLRPILILLCGMLLFNLPIVLYKLQLCIYGVLYFLFCFDKSVTANNKNTKPTYPCPESDTTSNNHNATVIIQQRKTIYFVRHGESTWNHTFNQGKHRKVYLFILGFIPGLVKAILYEIYLLLSGKMDRYDESVRLVFVLPFVDFVLCNRPYMKLKESILTFSI
jgi:hypothetical protein